MVAAVADAVNVVCDGFNKVVKRRVHIQTLPCMELLLLMCFGYEQFYGLLILVRILWSLQTFLWADLTFSCYLC